MRHEGIKYIGRSITMPRPTPRRLVKSACLLFVGATLLLNMHVIFRSMQPSINVSDVFNSPHDVRIIQQFNLTFLKQGLKTTVENRTVRQVEISSKPIQDKQSSSATYSELNPVNPTESQLRNLIAQINTRQHVRNLDKFDLKSGQNSVVVVVQVHSRIEYLKYLVDSLRNAGGIQNTLLIFSHDKWDSSINTLVRSIDFAPVLQIFYPFMMQAYSKEFPGEDPNDCPRDIKRPDAISRRCNNAEHPDRYGHYREARYVQTKHHWFWKINHVFDRLRVTKTHTGPVLLIEEDHYVAPDFLHILQQMFKLRSTNCKDCGILTLGGYDKHPTYGSLTVSGLWAALWDFIFGTRLEDKEFIDYVDVLGWASNKHNMGMALSRDVWVHIKKCAQPFCQFDDYNWDWSLQYIGMTCYPNRLKVMIAKSPRIFHIGECGVHHKAKGVKKCDAATKVSQLNSLLETNKKSLFPSSMSILSYPRMLNRVPKANGGWGDVRDHQLCLSFIEKLKDRR